MNQESTESVSTLEIRKLAAALQATIAAIRMQDQDPAQAQGLLKAAHEAAAAIARGVTPPSKPSQPSKPSKPSTGNDSCRSV
jgi:hypothetical protein